MLGLVARIDGTDGSRTLWGVPDGVVGEPSLLPDPDGVDEDEGCLLVVVGKGDQLMSNSVFPELKAIMGAADDPISPFVPLGVMVL